jgi:hypothetical protein
LNKEINNAEDRLKKLKKLKTNNTKQQQKKSNKQTSESTSKKKPATNATHAAVNSDKIVIKLPYPVLNDKRDMKTILGTLETKHRELMKKRHQNQMSQEETISHLMHLKRMNQSAASASSDANIIQKQQRNLEKYKQMEATYEAQRVKLEKQLDYVQLAIKLENIQSGSKLTFIFI